MAGVEKTYYFTVQTVTNKVWKVLSIIGGDKSKYKYHILSVSLRAVYLPLKGQIEVVFILIYAVIISTYFKPHVNQLTNPIWC